MLKWQVGDVTISRIVELEMSSPYSTKHPFIPEATPEKAARLSAMREAEAKGAMPEAHAKASRWIGKRP